jgi:hypothetical protein
MDSGSLALMQGLRFSGLGKSLFPIDCLSGEFAHFRVCLQVLVNPFGEVYLLDDRNMV